MHINIINNNPETVNVSIIEKLYNLLYGGDDPEYNTLVADATTYIKGTLNCDKLYKYKYDLLTTDFTDLFINYNDQYLYIRDANVKTVLLNNGFGDNFGVFLSIAQTSTSLPSFNNKSITSFDELQYFRNVTSLNKVFASTKGTFESIDLRNITRFNAETFYKSKVKHCKNSGNITYLWSQCFEDATELCEFDFTSVTFVGWQSVYNTKLTEVHFGGGSNIDLASQDGNAFRNNSILTTIDGLENTTIMPGVRCFFDCPSLLRIDLANAIGSIPDNLFSNCSSITYINIPYASGSIGQEAFYGCEKLATLNLNYAGITEIKKVAFYRCKALTTLSFPNLNKALGESTFRECESLQSVSFNTTNNVIKVIGASCFHNCINLETVSGLDGVTTINDQAFRYCIKLTSVGNMQPTTIGNGAFGECTKLSQIDLSHATSIGSETFYKCGLTNIDLSSAISISGNAFAENKSLQSVVWSNTLTTITRYLFNECSLLTSISNISHVIRIEQNAFKNCDLTGNLSFPNLEYIGQEGLGNNNNITGLSIPKIKQLESQCLINSNLTSLNWQDFRNIESWGWQPFNTQNSGYSNTIQCEKFVFDKITFISREAFHSISGLTTIIFNVDEMPTSDGDPFSAGCDNVQIYVKDSAYSSLSSVSYYRYMNGKVHRLSEYTGTY